MAIKGLHHNAYRCRDSEETRKFYEDFLGLPLAHTLEIRETKTGRKTDTLCLHKLRNPVACCCAAVGADIGAIGGIGAVGYLDRSGRSR
jgi:catechol 2,3-dioxygenase-like lactoylglutathione lyase family enzyme